MAYGAGIGEMVLFGGFNNNELGDTWKWDGTTWTQQHPAVSPSARSYASMADDSGSGQMLLFGGIDNSGMLGDTWVWGPPVATATRRPPNHGSCAPPR